MKVIEKYKNAELIQIQDDRYCVRVTKKFLWFTFVQFLYMHLKGTDVTCDHLIADSTIADLDRATYIFNAMCIKLGKT